jgi:hypothetical protein
MGRLLKPLILLTTFVGVCWPPLFAWEQSKPSEATTRGPNACALLPKEEVRKHLPWPAFVDNVVKIEEERVGAAGSACEYPSVRVQVLPFSPNFLDAQRKKVQVESVSGVGDEAFFVPRVRQYAEMIVKVGEHLLMLQAGVPTGQTVETEVHRVYRRAVSVS